MISRPATLLSAGRAPLPGRQRDFAPRDTRPFDEGDGRVVAMDGKTERIPETDGTTPPFPARCAGPDAVPERPGVATERRMSPNHSKRRPQKGGPRADPEGNRSDSHDDALRWSGEREYENIGFSGFLMERGGRDALPSATSAYRPEARASSGSHGCCQHRGGRCDPTRSAGNARRRPGTPFRRRGVRSRRRIGNRIPGITSRNDAATCGRIRHQRDLASCSAWRRIRSPGGGTGNPSA